MPYTTFMHSARSWKPNRKAHDVLRNHFRRRPHRDRAAGVNHKRKHQHTQDEERKSTDDYAERVRVKQRVKRAENNAIRRAFTEAKQLPAASQPPQEEDEWVWLNQRTVGPVESDVGPTEPLTDFIGGARL